jgi:hypothetical protein
MLYFSNRFLLLLNYRLAFCFAPVSREGVKKRKFRKPILASSPRKQASEDYVLDSSTDLTFNITFLEFIFV